MKLEVPKGKYILAVSGGVDSMALLDLLSKQPNLQVIVAHFNHNIRVDSAEDEKLVHNAAKRYKLKFESRSANLGKNASEEVARDARYEFFYKLKDKYQAKAIITAHHQDDLIETAMINVIRGSGRLGLSSIANNDKVLRPMLNVSKAEIVNYAKKHKLVWREDSTNSNQDYLRNYLRISAIPNLTSKQRKSLISKLDKVAKTNIEIDNKIATLSQTIGYNEIDRQLFSSLPADLGNELIAYHLRKSGVADFDSKTINRLSMAIKTSKPNSRHPIGKQATMSVKYKKAIITTP